MTSPKNLKAAFANVGIILIIFLASLGIVRIETSLLSYFNISSTQPTASFIIPTKGQHKLGEVFPLKIEVNNTEVPINAVQADIRFEAEKVEVIDITTEGSFANIFIQKEINNEVGWARLTGGLPNPGYSGESGTFATVLFKAKSPGLVEIEFLPSSMILANDGKATNILKTVPSVSHIITSETISNEEELRQQELIRSKDVLGTATDEDAQVILYEESHPSQNEIVLQAQPEKKVITKIFLETLEKFDESIINFWKKVVSLV